MNNPGFTVERLEQVLREVAAESPAYIYNNPGRRTNEAPCLYWHRDEPGCIFGHAVARLGREPESLFPGNAGTIATYLREWFGGDVEDYARFSEVQRLQDLGTSWGEAIKVLDREGESDV